MLDSKKILLAVAVGGGLYILSNILNKDEDQKHLNEWSKSLYEDLDELEKMAHSVICGELIYCITNRDEMYNLYLDIMKLKEKVSKAKTAEELDELSTQVSRIINQFDELLNW